MAGKYGRYQVGGKQKKPLCNLCTVIEETTKHMFCCRSKNAVEAHKKVFKNFTGTYNYV